MSDRFDLIVIGGGVVGLATAYKWQLSHPKHKVLVLEKEKDLASHQTGRNSGVIHSGIYYKPGSLKARTCVDGYGQIVEFVKKHGVKHDICGKLIVATREEELEQIDRILERGKQNGLSGLSILNSQEIVEIEPFVEGLKAIRVPQTGIIDYVGFSKKLAEFVVEINSESLVLRENRVIGLSQRDSINIVQTTKQDYQANLVICCGGLEADRLASLDNLDLDMRIVPFRGDYYDLTYKGVHKVKHLIYPVPNPDFPFLGVHFTRMIEGGVECGPNAVFYFKREGYSKTSFSIKDTASALGFIGTWKLFKTHWRYGLGEYKRAFSKALFLKALQGLIPSLKDEDIVSARAGVRAQALSKDGSLVDDFVIKKGLVATHVINAPSPAATACLAIADYIITNLEKK
jgi:L-2-hydroxyglutarate oxidase